MHAVYFTLWNASLSRSFIWQAVFVLDAAADSGCQTTSAPRGARVDDGEVEGEDEVNLVPDIQIEGEVPEVVILAEENHIDSSQFAKFQRTWTDGDVVPFEATFACPAQCRAETLDAILSHPEVVCRMDDNDAATITEDAFDMKLDFVEKAVAMLEVDGKQLWLVADDCDVSNISGDFVVVRVSSVASSMTYHKNVAKLVEQAEFIRLRPPARWEYKRAKALVYHVAKIYLSTRLIFPIPLRCLSP